MCPRPSRSAAPPTPASFDRAVASLRSTIVRPEVQVRGVPAPRRLAPHALALEADVVCDGTELASGRLVLLHDPAGHPSWAGTMRLVAYVRAELESEIATDPLLGGVGWSWVLDALEAQGAVFRAAAGTVTRAASESFGAMTADPASPAPTTVDPASPASMTPGQTPPIPVTVGPTSAGPMAGDPTDLAGATVAEIEIRASWSPVGDDLSAHLRGWCELLCYAAGLPPSITAARSRP